MKNRQPSLMVHTNPEFEISNLILDFEFDQHLGSNKHVINIIMWFRDMGCYIRDPRYTRPRDPRYENNYKALHLITTTLGRNVYNRVAHLEIAHDVWLKLCNTYEGSSEIKPSRRDIYNRQY
jgi:hypothetical protein